MNTDKRYLGDGVYVEKWCCVGGYVLTTSDGIEDTNTIYLEPEVVGAFEQYLKECRDETGGKG